MDKSLDEFELRPDPTTDYGVTALERLKNQFHHIGNKDMHNIINEFEFRPDRMSPLFLRCY